MAWLDPITTIQKRDWRKLFHNDSIIPVLMPPSGNLIIHVVMLRKLFMVGTDLLQEKNIIGWLVVGCWN
jgi:hypothetical protein